MFSINEFKINTVSESKTEGLFKIEPLPKGYANTLGTVFRRILLSSIPGAAVTSVKLAGVQHEYTTVVGLQDDVLNVVLAFKGISVVSHSKEPVTLKLQAKGEKGAPRVVTAGDIEPDAMVEIINPEYVITTLANEKASLNAEIIVEQGIGYALPNESVREEVGGIPVDAVFSPVRLVTVDSKNTRVGQQTDLDSLELKILTNGTISPSAAMFQAAQILDTMAEHLVENLRNLLDTRSTAQVQNATLPVSVGGQSEVGTDKPVLVSELNLSTRLTNALLNGNYTDLRMLSGLTEEEVSNIKGMGEKSYTELLEILAKNGIKLI